MKYLLSLLALLVFAGCGRKIYVNESGFDRPVKKNVLTYSNHFNGFPQKLDTNAIYVRDWQYQIGAGIGHRYAYFRFFNSGQVLYAEFDSALNLSHLDDLTYGIIGRYYFKKNQLRIQLFYRMTVISSISKLHGFIRDSNIYIYDISQPTPGSGSWGYPYSLKESPKNKKVFKWEYHQVPLKHTQVPDW